MRAIACSACVNRVLALWLAVVFAPAAETAMQAPSAAAGARADPAFSRPDPRRMPSGAALRAFLTELERTRQSNTFCFVQQSFEPRTPNARGESMVWMVWREGARIQDLNTVRQGERYVPDAALDDPTRGRAMASSSGIVNLRTDVVPTDADLRGSTSLVSRPWVDRLLTQCRRVGARIRIPPFDPPLHRKENHS
ncbi:hypothetical protein [Acidovorax sp. NCPPB 4044]|uniref:hypothetical protein n=1 Tax=Acidovorax sp. NCPPB 4044 TaxID=2940490 RepID=UPI002302EB92|nr:hypothetical protein [Acidovorax sp. NCPPB 4044]MDA8523506.1 hypothetical protein [Acidovorax sp. NCPPB 4044]